MTDEEKQELETLRAEKVTRQQTERAQSALEKAGVPSSFASLLIGTDDATTDSRVAAFAKQYQETLSADVKSRLPKEAPVVAAAVPKRPRRGIQRM